MTEEEVAHLLHFADVCEGDARRSWWLEAAGLPSDLPSPIYQLGELHGGTQELLQQLVDATGRAWLDPSSPERQALRLLGIKVDYV